MIDNQAPFAHLRPATAPEMLDRAYSVVVRVAPVLLLASFLVSSEHLLSLAANLRSADNSSNPYAVAGLLTMVLIGELAAAAALLALFQGLIFPLRPLSPKALFRTALRKLPAYLLTHLLYIFICAMAFALAWHFFTNPNSKDPRSVTVGAGVSITLASLYVLIRFSLAPIAALIEDCGPIRSFGRSWALMSNRPRSHEFATDRPPLRWMAVALAPAAVVTTVLAAFIAYSHFALNAFLFSNTPETAVAKDLLWFTATFLASPLYWTGLMTLYVEYRMRHEALDFYLRIRELRQKENTATTLT